MRREHIPLLAALILVALFLLAVFNRAWTQELVNHDWITQGNYKEREAGYSHCCDAQQHCRRLLPEQVEAVDGDSWRIVSTGDVFRRGERGNYPSQDGRFWECRWAQDTRLGQRCFFFPEAGL